MLQAKSIVRCIGVVILFSLQLSSYSQSYQLVAVSGTFTPLSEATHVAAIQTDDAVSSAIDIGFNFVFNGISYSKVVASSNGFLSFNLSSGDGNSNSFSSGDPNIRPLIAPLWDDLDGYLGVASYKLEGTAPNRVFTFEWLNWKWNYEAVAPVISFQVKLYESTNYIEYLYRQEAGNVNNGSASVGLSISAPSSGGGDRAIENRAGEIPLFYSLSGFETQPTLSTTTENSNINTKPVSGQLYRFNSAVKPEPTNQATALYATSDHKSITVSWTDATGSQLPDGYLIIASDQDNILDPVDFNDVVSDIDLSDGLAIVKVDQGIQTYSGFANLQYNSTYYFRVYSFTNSGVLIDYKITPTAPQTSLLYTPIPEPTNHVTAFTATQGYTNITLSWADAVGNQLPEGYLILASTNSSFSDPVDLSNVMNDSDLGDGSAAYKVNQGVQSFTGFTNLQYNNTYYFRIYPYTNAGVNSDYKTSPAAPQASVFFNQKLEPSDYATSFKAISNGSNITLSWTDAVGVTVPDYYLIQVSSSNIFVNPVDGVDPLEDNDISDGAGLIKVAQGVKTASNLLNLQSNNTYFFRIIPYTNIGTAINFKTDGVIPKTLVYNSLEGQQNSCLSFDGIDDYIDCGQQELSSFTIEAWVNTPVTNVDQAIISTLHETNPSSGFELHIGSTGRPVLTIRNGVSWTDVIAPSAINPNVWVHLAATFDGSTAKLLVNGIMVNSSVVASYVVGDNVLTIGRRSVSPMFYSFKGSIDNACVWSKAISELEVQQYMYSTLLGNENGLIAYYMFNQGGGYGDNTKILALNDRTVNATNGTLTNFGLSGVTSNWVPRDLETSENNCLSFDGIDDYVAVPAIASNLTQLTIETWVNFSSVTAGSGLFNTNSWGSKDMHLQVWNCNNIEFAVNGNSATAQASYTFSANTWYHLAVTYNSTSKQVLFYVNGKLINTVTLTTAVSANLTEGQIGAYLNSRFFAGKIDEYRIWNTARTQQQIADFMCQSVISPASNTALIAYYKMNQKSGVVINDASSANHPAVLNKFALTGSVSTWLTSDISKYIKNYTFTPYYTPYTSISGGTSFECYGESTLEGPINIGFSFNFDGVNYTQLFASTYGLLSFNAIKPAESYDNGSANSSALPYIAPFWDYFNNGMPKYAYYKTEGTAPNRIFSFEWRNFTTNATADISFIVKLYETSNRIEYYYRRDNPNPYFTASVGYFFVDGSFINLYETTNSPKLETVYRNSGNEAPSTGQTYRLEPLPAKPEPTSYPTELSSKIENGDLTLSWNDAVTNQPPDGYLLMASKTNTFTTLVDGTDLATDDDLGDGFGLVKVKQGVQQYKGWKQLETSEIWYFRLYPYTGAGASINYKTSGTVAQIKVTYPHYLFTERNNKYFYADNSFVTDYQYLTESESLLGDFNNDGKLDVFVGGDPGGNIVDFNASYTNDGEGYFTSKQIFTHYDYESLSWADSDNDGDLDFIITGTIGNLYYSSLYVNRGSSSSYYFNEIENLFQKVKGGYSSWADYDNDGDIDLLLSGNTGTELISKIYRNNGGNNFTEQGTINLTGFENGASAWADYDRDGFKDILLSGSGITKVYRNTGHGNFEEQISIQLTGLSNSSVAWGDYDNDGYPDILMAGSDIAKIYHNNGDNTFTELTNTLLSGFSSGKVAWGDYDNDGDSDILLSCNNFTKLYNNNYPASSFTEVTEFTFSGIENGATLMGDYDNDNDLDILIPGIQKEYRNNCLDPNSAPTVPSGLIATTTATGLLLKWNKSTDNTTPSSAITYNIKVGTTNSLEDIVSSMSLNNGSRLVSERGNMDSDTSILLHIPRGTYYFAVQSIDNSNTPSAFSNLVSYTMDYVQASGLNASVLSANSLVLRWTNGNGNSRIVFCKEGNSGNALPVNGTAYAPDALFSKGDQIGSTGWYCMYSGKADSAIVSGLSPDKSYVFQVVEYTYPSGVPNYYTAAGNANPGVFGVNSFLEQLNISLIGFNFGSAVWGDYDNDGFLDFIISGDAYNNTSEYLDFYYTLLYHNNGDGSFTEQDKLIGTSFSSISFGDYDNDGFKEVLALEQKRNSFGETSIYKIINHKFVKQTTSSFPAVWNGSAIWGDYNNDGLLDFIVSGGGADKVTKLYKNTGIGFEEQVSVVLPQLLGSSVVWADFNNDGNLDLLLVGVSSDGNTTKIYQNNGAKNNYSFTELTGNQFVQLTEVSIATGDYDKNGFIDFFITGIPYLGANPIAKLYNNNGDGTFSESAISSTITAVSTGTASWADTDNDGDLDLLVSGSSSSNIYRNNYPLKSFTKKQSLVGLVYTSASWGDYDNDGDLDVILLGENSNTGVKYTKVYRNTAIMKAGGFVDNKKPEAPRNTRKELLRGGMLLSWDGVDSDETPINTMSYNLRVGKYKDSLSLYAPQFVDSLNFKNRTVAQIGNTGLNAFYKVNNLPDLTNNGYYYWQVQAVDGGYLGGSWSAVDSMQIKATQAYFSADTVCQGNITSFRDNSVAYDGIASWHWDFGDTSTVSTLQNPTHIYQYPGEHIVRLVVANASGKTDTIYNTILVKPIPKVLFTATDVCSGTTTTILNSTTIADINVWAWDFGDGQNSGYANPASHTYGSTGNYTITLSAIAKNGCSADASHNIVVTTTPNATLSLEYGTPTFCKGDSVIYAAPDNSLYSYQWRRNGVDIAENTSKIKVKDASGGYQVVIINKLVPTCSATSEEKQIAVKERPGTPVIEQPSSKNFCSDKTMLLTTELKTGLSYQWLLNGGTIKDSTRNQLAAKSSGDYTVKVSNSNGCEAISNAVELTMNPLPEIPSVSYGETSICDGSNVTFSVASNPAIAYQWFHNNTPVSGATSSLFTTKKSGSYFLQVSNNNSCSAKTTPVDVVVKEIPAKPIIMEATNTTTFCPGTGVELKISNVYPDITYQWKRSGVAIAGVTQPSYQGQLPSGDYVVQAYNGVCSIESDILTLTTKPSPPKPSLFAKGPNVWLLACDNITAKDYRWYFNEQMITGAKSNQYVANQNFGSYYVSINDGGDCYTNSDVITITSDGVINGVDELFGDAILVHPNPTAGVVNVALGVTLSGELKVEVVNAFGQAVGRFQYKNSSGFTIDLSELPDGVYFCRMSYQNSVVVKKVIKQ